MNARPDTPRGLDENGRRWFAARLMIALEDVRKFGGMSVQELKHALKDIPGVENLTVNYAPKSGNMRVTIAGRTVEVPPIATNAQIAAAFAAPTPPITQVSTPKMSITGAVNASSTIKDLIANSRTTIKAAHDKLVTNAGRVNDAATALSGLGDDLGNEADDLLSMIGQFKNDLSPAAPAAAPTPTPLPAAPTITPAPATTSV